MENSLEGNEKKKKKVGKILYENAPRFDGQEFWPKCNVIVFAWKLVDSIYGGPRNKWKILKK